MKNSRLNAFDIQSIENNLIFHPRALRPVVEAFSGRQHAHPTAFWKSKCGGAKIDDNVGNNSIVSRVGLFVLNSIPHFFTRLCNPLVYTVSFLGACVTFRLSNATDASVPSHK